MLGELYNPKGMALETAGAVLEIEDPHACNVALGCSCRCGYCYGSKFLHMTPEQYGAVRQPVKPPIKLVGEQLISFRKMRKLGNVNGVFLSFLTEPFLECNRVNSNDLIEWLVQEQKIRVATCSKLNVANLDPGVRHGMTIVSFDKLFHKTWEPYTLDPEKRIDLLMGREEKWVSMEPYPCSAIYSQDIEDVLDPLVAVDRIVFGKWNYDARASTDLARLDYTRDIAVARDFCREHAIELHIKSDTLKFIGQEFA